MPSSRDQHPYVSRGGLKLAHALDEFQFDATGLRCADLGCSTGGFTDCLLQRGAAAVLAVDTAYGVLEYKLRQDARVTVRERSNALHLEPGDDADLAPFARGCDLVVFDLGWTPQKLAIPAALRWLSDDGHIISLIKPQYEQSHVLGSMSDDAQNGDAGNGNAQVGGARGRRGGRRSTSRRQPTRVLDDAEAHRICDLTLEAMPQLGVQVLGCVMSPIRGGATRGQKHGNIEYLALLARTA